MNEVSRYEQFISRQYRLIGEPKPALDVLTRIARNFETQYRQGNAGRLFPTYAAIVGTHIALGNVEAAETVARRLRPLLAEARTWSGWDLFGTSWLSNIEEAWSVVYEAKGQYREAELAYHRAQPLFKDAMEKSSRWPSTQPRADWYRGLNSYIANEGRMKALQGRLVEAENDIRQALLNQLRQVGKYHAGTAVFVRNLANVLVDQGRLTEAESLIRAAFEIQKQIGFKPDSAPLAATVVHLATVLELQNRHAEAAEMYSDADQRTRNWEPARRQTFQLDQSRIFTLYALGKTDEGIELAKGLVARRTKSFGPSHFSTMYARAVLAAGLTRAGNNKEALAEFRVAMPLLIAAPRETSDDDTGTEANRDAQIQRVLEAYVETLVRAADRPAGEVAAETFSLAETMRSRSVQRAITAAATRMAQPNEAVSKLVRSEQDLDKQIRAHVALLNRLLAQPQGERDDKALQALNVQLEKLKSEHRTARSEIERRQPRYSELVDPKPPSAKDVSDLLRPGEALLSFFFGRQSSFVWVLRNGEPAVLAAIPVTLQEIERRVTALREALEPPDEVPIPAFDVAAAADLYDLLLKPVEAHWRGAKSLLLVTNGALGFLPLGLLPTSHVTLAAVEQARFAEYRQVPWLARTHAVTLVPSAAALISLRRSPPGAANRDTLIGFGDPYFTATQAAAEMPLASTYTIGSRGLVLRRRSLPATRNLNKAVLADLKPLPDTALELKAVARTLNADPTKVLYLGKAANEQVVKTTNLARFKIVAFSTHGLLPNDLDGLTQPALALTAPDIAGVDGDGLLTMEEILGLKLDADWVLLSACNTAAGTSNGAEAASGLGRAFFYAGARALLVTNWSVDSASARDLVSGLFERHVATTGITRSEALRQAMMHLVDNGNLSDADGRVLFTYAHPLFWAPYSVIGDGT